MPTLPGRQIRLAQFTRSFHLGGTEGQVVELLRGLPERYEACVGVLDESGPLLEAVWQLGLLPEEFPLRGSVAQPNTAVQIGRIALWLQKQRVELVHAHDFYSALVVVPAAKLAGVKVVVGRLDLAHWHNRVQRAALREATRAADHVIVNADAIRRMLMTDEGIPGSRITVVHNGLDLSRFDARAAQGLDAPLPSTGELPAIVHVANMNHPVKRQEDLLAAVAILNAERPRVQAYLVGDGARRSALERLARELGVAQQVHFLGHRTDVAALYRHGKVGVLCSSAEGLSNAVIEGMASGLPMVVTRVGGNPDLVREGETGHLVAPERPVELARALRGLLDAPEDASRMGERARRFVQRNLSLRSMVAGHDAVYQRVLRGAEVLVPRPSIAAVP